MRNKKCHRVPTSTSTSFAETLHKVAVTSIGLELLGSANGRQMQSRRFRPSRASFSLNIKTLTSCVLKFPEISRGSPLFHDSVLCYLLFLLLLCSSSSSCSSCCQSLTFALLIASTLITSSSASASFSCPSPCRCDSLSSPVLPSECPLLQRTSLTVPLPPASLASTASSAYPHVLAYAAVCI